MWPKFSARLFLSALAVTAAVAAAGTSAQPAATPVDLVLVLAVDASGSISDDRWDLERQGYAAAFRDPAVVAAIKDGAIGAIAVTLVEWSGQYQQSQILRWAIVKDTATASAFADQLASIPHLYKSWTSISQGMTYSGQLADATPYAPLRRVVDVSGDGPDSTSQLSIRGTSQDTQRLIDARDRLVKDGLVINGLPIFGDPQIGNFPLDQYYMRYVIGGPGAFEIVAQDFNAFADAVRRKLIEEIAGVDEPASPVAAG